MGFINKLENKLEKLIIESLERFCVRICSAQAINKIFA